MCYVFSSTILLLEIFANQNKTKTQLGHVQMKISIPAFAAILLIVFFATLYMANADFYLSSPVQTHEKQDTMKSMITDGLRLANQSYQRWQEKQEYSQSDQQEQPLTANVLNSRNHMFDNHSPSVISGLPY
jgi:hypothetical protein